MSSSRPVSPRDLETLSAYLDGRLTAAQAAALERRLADDASLRQELEGLRNTVRALHSLPARPVPRSFTLRPSDVGRPERFRRPYPVLQLGTALAGIAFILVVGADVLTRPSIASSEMAAQAPAPAAAPESGAASLFAALATPSPAPTAAPAMEDRLTLTAVTESPTLFGASAPTACDSCPHEATGVPATEKAEPTLAAALVPTQETMALRAPVPPSPSPNPVRMVEVALGVVTLGLAALAVRARRRDRV